MMMSVTEKYSAGDTVKLATHSPIDFEGVGPTAHELGKVVAPTNANGRSDCLAVRFERSSVPWLIPFKYLEPVRFDGRANS